MHVDRRKLRRSQTSKEWHHTPCYALLHTHTHTNNLYRKSKQILSKSLLLQEIVKALASLSEYVVFVNT